MYNQSRIPFTICTSLKIKMREKETMPFVKNSIKVAAMIRGIHVQVISLVAAKFSLFSGQCLRTIAKGIYCVHFKKRKCDGTCSFWLIYGAVYAVLLYLCIFSRWENHENFKLSSDAFRFRGSCSPVLCYERPKSN